MIELSLPVSTSSISREASSAQNFGVPQLSWPFLPK
jgi:hypothetical protein